MKCIAPIRGNNQVLSLSAAETRPTGRLSPRRYQCATTEPPRRGVVLILVLVIVAALSFAVYSFSQQTLLEYTAARSSLDQMQRRELASSAIELSSIAIRQESGETPGVYEAQSIVLDGDRPGYMAIVPMLPDPGNAPDFGLLDESSKLNLNALDLRSSRRQESRDRLMALPKMTVQIADSILDWMDADDNRSEFGAETSYYSSLRPPYRPRQGRFTYLRELLQVKGVTEALLLGEDANANGLLDPAENDGNATDPADNADDRLDRGWIADITLVSREAVLRPDGETKINLNQRSLANLYDELLPGFGPEMARFVIVFRMRGVSWPDDVTPNEKPDTEQLRLERIETAQRRLQAQLHGGGTSSGGSHRDLERDGIRLPRNAAFQIQSLVELFGGRARITIDNEDQFIESPWSADPGTLSRLLPLADALLTTSGKTAVEGRINVNQASEHVLNSIPNLSRANARAISRLQPSKRKAGGHGYDSIAWLTTRGVMPVSQLRKIAPYINVGGDVQGGFALGWYRDAQPVAAIEFQLDVSAPQRRMLLHRDLPILPKQLLGLQETP